MNPRGVTLVELLAAVSILVVVTALSLPAVQTRLAGARLEAAQGQLGAAVIAARARAIEAGQPLVLVARRARRDVELVIRPLGDGASPMDQPRGDGDRAAASTGVPWCTVEGVEVMEKPPTPDAEETTDGPPVEAPVPWQEVRIAVFCPDGSSVTSGPKYLRVGSDVWQVNIGEWLAGVSFVPYRPSDSPDEADSAPSGATGTPAEVPAGVPGEAPTP